MNWRADYSSGAVAATQPIIERNLPKGGCRNRYPRIAIDLAAFHQYSSQRWLS
jgi:hypothetical protein